MFCLIRHVQDESKKDNYSECSSTKRSVEADSCDREREIDFYHDERTLWVLKRVGKNQSMTSINSLHKALASAFLFAYVMHSRSGLELEASKGREKQIKAEDDKWKVLNLAHLEITTNIRTREKFIMQWELRAKAKLALLPSLHFIVRCQQFQHISEAIKKTQAENERKLVND